ncbi:23S rRNA (uracil-5-)-methyltransferase RumA [Candidatus Peribacteria bacterium RIFCSPLOWO2_12_FULL_55_15]|nr:MAG: 23S rRNA (uracil-5-)-methyltransferase RumA [Candidatus Peribacteria bacterium RIFCSPHIGHO2_01_FULL_54_22]OGJ62224.1 MAG: 23S rRNA (uracil-5-)-methyltransferase RumA [Candidatus Peribacteria bacterium RIFCSPHIGHO2_02_FULL_55_24]OGJ64139.1 MAG: 23S rRNA (uracil-5-)-methyltransferase RumA [Candidatus Peribacteria bacterium RIFCSPHIGHO2_12_FULL_54_10]OGJ69064.1 MAG: 23S rRNA (uracil-5-)-methyltransferase RumA [Candidatus Peribacteria bacterium RIFCSPLOWO2_01_FULL_54_110]OGJ72317.1 MAG: 23S
MPSEEAFSALQAGQRYTVTVEKVTHGGAGLAHIGGFPIFIPRTIPGQEVEITVTNRLEAYAEARVERLLKLAKDEIRPRCAHAHECGGCLWQNLPYVKQLQYKEDIVRETLEHLTPVDAGLRSTLSGRVLKIIPSPQVFNYRNKLELSFGYAAMRTKEHSGKRIYLNENSTIGFHPSGQLETVMPVTECHLYDEQLSALLLDVRRFIGDRHLSVYNPKTHRGLLRTLLLRRGVHTGEQMICFMVNARKRELEPLFQYFLRFGGRSGLVSLLVAENCGVNDKPESPRVHCLVGKASITERLFDLEFEISPFSFFQTNTLGTEKLYQALVDSVDITQRDTVLDAYCGIGAIGQYLARFCQKVVGIESHPSAIEDALRSSGKNRIGNISFYRGLAEQLLSVQLKPGGKYTFDVIILDPPRAGLHPVAKDAVLAHAPRQIVYISYNTATFARDLGGFLKNGYELRSVQPVDIFPHTAHIETVSVLQKK